MKVFSSTSLPVRETLVNLSAECVNIGFGQEYYEWVFYHEVTMSGKIYVFPLLTYEELLSRFVAVWNYAEQINREVLHKPPLGAPLSRALAPSFPLGAPLSVVISGRPGGYKSTRVWQKADQFWSGRCHVRSSLSSWFGIRGGTTPPSPWHLGWGLCPYMDRGRQHSEFVRICPVLPWFTMFRLHVILT